MNNRYFVTVPINQTGIEEIEQMQEASANFETYIIPAEEYRALWKAHVFDVINNRFGLMIDDNESEKVTAEQLEEVLQAIDIVPGVFVDAVKAAISFGTRIYLDF